MSIGESQLEGDRDRDSERDEGEPEVGPSRGWRHTLRQVRRDATARWGMYVVAFVLLITLYTAVDSNLSRLTLGMISDYAFAEALPIFDHPTRIPPPGEGSPHEPPAFHTAGSLEHPLGTDGAGRDYFTRVVYGAQVSVTVGIVSTGLALVGGTIVGSVAGFYGGRVDDALMRAVETLYAIPPLILIIVFTEFASAGQADIQYAIVGIGLAFIPVFARIIRSEVLSVREMDYIEAARAAGVTDRTIIRRHVVPNSFAPVLVYATLQIGVMILLVAGLSFLGYGAQPPTPDWGQMLSDSHDEMHGNVWLSVWPGLAIMLTIMGFNLFGDGLQDALDPRLDD